MRPVILYDVNQNPIATDSNPLIVGYPRQQLDAFGRLRVSQPETLFDSTQVFSNLPLIWDDQQTSGAGTTSTWNTNQASSTLAVSNLTAGTRVRQTFRSFAYQSGKSLQWLCTGIIGTPVTGITRRIGFFNTNNGLYFESSPTTMNVVTRTFTSGAAVNNSVAQASWNLDTLSGAGGSANPSGITADWSKAQIFGCFFEWLGVGSAFMYVVIGGNMILVHRFDTANTGVLVYMQKPDLPLRYEITNSGTGAAATLLAVCCSVNIEGGRTTSGTTFSINRGATAMTTNNNASIYPLITIRLRTSYIGADISNILSSIICTSTAAFNWTLLLNPTVVGTAFAFTGITNSGIEADLVSTNATTLTGGTAIAGGTTQQTNDGSALGNVTDFRLGATIAGVSDILSVAVQRITGTLETFYGSLTWTEST